MNFNSDFNKIIANLKDTENHILDDKITHIFDFRKESEKKYFNSYFLLLLLTFIYFLVEKGIASEISIFSIKLNDFEIVKWLIPTLIGFLYYRGVIAFIYEDLYRQFIIEYINNRLPNMIKQDFEWIWSSPSFFNMERFIANKYDNKISLVFGILIIVLIMLLPLGLIIYTNIYNISGWSNSLSNWIKISIVIANSIITIRIVYFIIFYLLKALKDN